MEKRKQLEAFGRLLLVCICAGLYAWGGMENKWLRRFLAPGLCAGGCFALTLDWRYFVQMPLMMASLSLGYAGDSVFGKVVKRAVFGFANGISGSVSDLWNKRFLISAFWTVFLTTAFIVIGVWNPLPNARIEELFLGVLVFIKPIMSARRVYEP